MIESRHRVEPSTMPRDNKTEFTSESETKLIQAQMATGMSTNRIMGADH